MIVFFLFYKPVNHGVKYKYTLDLYFYNIAYVLQNAYIKHKHIEHICSDDIFSYRTYFTAMNNIIIYITKIELMTSCY